MFSYLCSKFPEVFDDKIRSNDYFNPFKFAQKVERANIMARANISVRAKITAPMACTK